MKKGIYVDFSLFPPLMDTLLVQLRTLKEQKIECLFIDWADSFPWNLDERICSRLSYPDQFLHTFFENAEQEGIETVPVFSMMKNPCPILKLESYKHLRANKAGIDILDIHAPGVRKFFEDLIDDMVSLIGNGISKIYLRIPELNEYEELACYYAEYLIEQGIIPILPEFYKGYLNSKKLSEKFYTLNTITCSSRIICNNQVSNFNITCKSYTLLSCYKGKDTIEVIIEEYFDNKYSPGIQSMYGMVVNEDDAVFIGYLVDIYVLVQRGWTIIREIRESLIYLLNRKLTESSVKIEKHIVLLIEIISEAEKKGLQLYNDYYRFYFHEESIKSWLFVLIEPLRENYDEICIRLRQMYPRII